MGIRELAEHLNLSIATVSLALNDSDEVSAETGRRVVEAAARRRHDPRIDYVAGQGFPFVAFGRSESGGVHAWVDLDFEAGAEAAVERLVGFGHRRIGIGVPDDDAMQGRVYFPNFSR